MKLVSALAIAGALAAVSVPAFATPLVENSGWNYDQVDSVGANSESSPWTFTTTDNSVFSVVDGFIAGDVYTIINDATMAVVGTTTFYSGSGVQTTGTDCCGFNADWADASYSKIAIDLAPGTYAFDIQGDGAGGLPAGFGVRLDSSVPEPTVWALMILGLAMIGFAARRRTQGLAAAA